jgi:hypothetical protein
MDTEAPETDPKEQGLGPRRSGSPNPLNLVPHHSCTALTRTTDKTTTPLRIDHIWSPCHKYGLKSARSRVATLAIQTVSRETSSVKIFHQGSISGLKARRFALL